MELDTFVRKWTASAAAERAHKDTFLLDLCDVLEVPRPRPATGDRELDRYCFECDATLLHEGDRRTVGKIDLYKRGCFLLEAKQGSEQRAAKRGIGRRETPAWAGAMHDALGQALAYARILDPPPPFLVVCDIGYCFDLYAAFDGSGYYRPFPGGRSSRIYLADLPQHPESVDRLQRIFTDPLSLDPSHRQLRVTREVAVHLAGLAQELEASGHPTEAVATFLMRCLFTIFAEDVGLLPEHLFSESLRRHWIPHPESFAPGLSKLWQAMREGGTVFPVGRLRCFGERFYRSRVIPLTAPQLERLLEAASYDWSDVEPAVFGTLLERALDPKERQRLGAHFTPRAYVERLVRQTVEEPLRREWDLVRSEVREAVRRRWHRRARKAVEDFHERLCSFRVLDPACGSGNFLYVTLDLLKALESEVLSFLADLGGAPQDLLALRGNTVTPDQLHGIEVKWWARQIAELVLWIGYLQWQRRSLGSLTDLPEPVLRDDHNFEHRDALLATRGEEVVMECAGRPATRWDGETFRRHAVTGRQVPDERARVPIVRLLDPRSAEWPRAEVIVGNPPFVGNKRLRAVLGDSYVEALRAAYPEVPESADYVMYWWSKAARLVRDGKAERFGFITTNSIRQRFNRRVVAEYLSGEPPLSLEFAVPDHPWVEEARGAAVRIAMTVAARGTGEGVLAEVTDEEPAEVGAQVTLVSRRGRIHADLSVGPEVSRAVPLRSNEGLCGQGVKVVGDGFYLEAPFGSSPLSPVTGAPLVRRIVGTRHVLEGRPGDWIIDFFGLEAEEAERLHPAAFQRLLTRVKPLRDQNRRASIRELWWRFAWERPTLRRALRGLDRYLVTPSVSKHRLFMVVPSTTLWDGSLFAIALDDLYFLGVLSSRVHGVWALAAGGRIGVGNDPTWTAGSCFGPFPFPDPPPTGRDRIRSLAARIVDHREEQLRRNPGLSLTALYNVVERVRAEEPLSEAQQGLHDQALASILARLHDELDEAVMEAYGWPPSSLDHELLERLVLLNHERAAEEERGRVRWLRPEVQAPGRESDLQPDLPVAWPSVRANRSGHRLPWPKDLPARVGLVRDLLSSEKRAVSVDRIARRLAGARSREVEAVLASLAALGLAVVLHTSAGPRWQAVERSAA